MLTKTRNISLSLFVKWFMIKQISTKPARTRRPEDVPICPILLKMSRPLVGPKDDLVRVYLILELKCLISTWNQEI